MACRSHGRIDAFAAAVAEAPGLGRAATARFVTCMGLAFFAVGLRAGGVEGLAIIGSMLGTVCVLLSGMGAFGLIGALVSAPFRDPASFWPKLGEGLGAGLAAGLTMATLLAFLAAILEGVHMLAA